MTESDAENLIRMYSRSYFHEDSAAGWFESNENAKRIVTNAAGTIAARAIGGSRVPIAKGRELTAAMIENVDEARHAVEATSKRLERARVDGLLDKDSFSSLSKKTKAAWLAAVQVVKGDYHRAAAEAKQWQEYAELASADKLPTLNQAGGIHGLIKTLAEAKSYPPDPRLPPERDDEEAPF